MAAQDAESFHWRYPDLDDKNFELHGKSLLILIIVFAVLLFVTLVCVYVRWSCHEPDPYGSGLNPTEPLGLDPQAISTLPVLLHRKAAGDKEGDVDENLMCSICLSEFSEGEKVKMLPNCSHTFHPDCVDQWLSKQSNCPLCRTCVLKERSKMEVDEDVV